MEWKPRKFGPDSGLHGLVVDLEWDPDENDGAILCIGFGGESHEKVIRPELLSDDERSLIESTFIVEFTNSDAVKLLDAGFDITAVADLQTMAWLLNENQPLDLERVYKRYCKKDMDKRLIRTNKRVLFRKNNGKFVPLYRAPRAQLHAYCRRDVVAERELYRVLADKLQAAELLDYFRDEEMPYTMVLIHMSRAGLPINLDDAKELQDELEARHSQLEAELRESAAAPEVFNLASSAQVRQYLFGNEVHVAGRISLEDYEADRIPEHFWPDEPTGKEKLWIKGTWVWGGLSLDPKEFTENTGEPSTSREALLLNHDTREHPWVERYLEWHKLHTLLTTYLRKFPVIARPDPQYIRDGLPRIHSTFKQTGTRTGRLSSVNTNLQNMPSRGEMGKRVRALFQAPKDYPFLMGDFSQLETRLMAHFSGDPELIRIFRENEDPFISLGSKIYGKPLTKESPERTATKNVWYANGYGAQPPKMWRMITLDGVKMKLSEVEDLWEELQDLVPVYFEWRDDLIERAKVDGYVTTIGGRRRRVRFAPGMTWKEEAHGERAAGNAAVQGSAADIVRRVMVRWPGTVALQLCAQVHDELIYQYLARVTAEQREHDRLSLQEAAETGHGYRLDVPLVFDAKVATSWADK